MKLNAFAVGVAAVLTLIGCQGTDMDQEGRQADRHTIEPTGFEEGQQDSSMERNMENRGNRNITDNRQVNDRRRNVDQNRNMGNTGHMDNDEYDVSEEAADKITDEIDKVDSAYVLTTGNNAYVAVVMDNDNNRNKTDDMRSNRHDNRSSNLNKDNISNEEDGISDDLKKQISDIVQSVDSNVDQVYVTTNPDFADLTNNYMNDLNDGKPIRGFFDQIGNMIERVFPQNRR